MFFQNNTLRIDKKNRLLLLALVTLPFLITAFERLLLVPAVSVFPLDRSSVHLFKVSTVSLILLSIVGFSGKQYGLELRKKHSKVIGSMFLALISVGYVFLLSLQSKNLFTPLAVVHLVNWVITVFREEVVLRGIIQTEANGILKGSFLKISYPIWLTTFVFMIWHLVNLTTWPTSVVLMQMLSCIPSGIILGLIREKTDSTLLTYLLHICGDLLFFSMHTFIFGRLFFSLI